MWKSMNETNKQTPPSEATQVQEDKSVLFLICAAQLCTSVFVYLTLYLWVPGNSEVTMGREGNRTVSNNSGEGGSGVGKVQQGEDWGDGGGKGWGRELTKMKGI